MTDLAVVMPPATIRYRVTSRAQSEEEYKQIGRDGVDCFLAFLEPHSDLKGRPANVLDFGCGCARSIQFLISRCPKWTIAGSDIDEVSVSWSQQNVQGATFETNAAMPPLRHADGRFDFIYALSVFSHLPADKEDAWLQELVRILKPGGFLYLTFTGQRVLEHIPNGFPPEIVALYRSTGFAYFANIGDGILPGWYQTSLQSGDYVASRLPAHAKALKHTVGGHMNWQDSMLIKKAAP